MMKAVLTKEVWFVDFNGNGVSIPQGTVVEVDSEEQYAIANGHSFDIFEDEYEAVGQTWH